MFLISRYSSKLQYAIIATILGNMLQWFDFSLFGMMLPIFTTLFFPGKESSFFFVLFAFGAFARALGGLFFGYLGDTLGRKSALVGTILFMTIPISLVAILPPYKEIGITAGILLGILYVFQGFCVGGEFPGSIVFLEESAPPNKRGSIGSWSYFGVTLGMLLVAIDLYELNRNLSSENLQNWGWRFPFYMGAIIGVIGALMRHYLKETPIFQEARQTGQILKKPLADTFRMHKKALLTGMAIYLLDVIGFNLILIYSGYYFSNQFKLDLHQSFKINMMSVLILLIFIPIMGKFGNRIGNHRLAKISAICMFVFAYPLYWILGQNTLAAIYSAQGILVFILASYVCNMPVILFELYPTKVRYTCVGVAINFSVALFGGTCPILIHYLINLTGLSILPSFYLMIAAAISFFTLRIQPAR
jgi:MHS family proline/betaine transporter-like MFS transporter